MIQDQREAYYYDRVRESGRQYAGFDLGSVEILLSFLYTYDLLHQSTGRYMSDYGVSKSSMKILLLLRHGPQEGMQLHDLGNLLFVSRANITGLIDHLEMKGYVKRIVAPQDRRARFARITKKAEALLDQFMPVHYLHIKGMMQGLSGQEKETLLSLLKKLRVGISTNIQNDVNATSAVAGFQDS